MVQHPVAAPKRLIGLEGPLWVADLMDVSRVTSVSALRRFAGQYRRKNGFFDESKLYHRYNRGERRPSKVERKLWLELFPQADRVAKLPLLEVLDGQWSASIDEQNHIYSRLSPSITRLVSRGSVWVEHKESAVLLLRPNSLLPCLVRSCQVDALPLILMILSSIPDDSMILDKYAENLVAAAMDIFSRLSVFPPFQLNRTRLINGIVGGLSTCHQISNQLQRFPAKVDTIQESADVVEALQLMGSVGLVGPALRSQIRIVNWYLDDVRPEERADLRKWCYAARSSQVMVMPTDPFWQALKRLKHNSTRADRPIVLPRRGRPIDDFRIANVLGKAEVRWDLLK
jgi:hypothetical protein